MTDLSNEGVGRDRMVVVIDARGASSLALTRHMSLLKHLAVVLNQHYPVGVWVSSSVKALAMQ